MSDTLMQWPVTANFVKAVLAAGTLATISSTNAVMYAVEGKIQTKAQMTNVATPTTDAVTGAAFTGVLANKGSIFAICLDIAAAVKVVQGSIVDLDSAGAFKQSLPQFGPMPNTLCPIGYLIIKAGSTANNTTGFIFGTSNMVGVTGITYTFGDLSTLPPRPISS